MTSPSPSPSTSSLPSLSSGSLNPLISLNSLRWIFVGGKGGVGKTTTSCSLAAALSSERKSVLLISTDPAHNLSDAFGQKFSKVPTLVEGFPNLFAMEIDPNIEVESSEILSEGSSSSLLSELASAIPGIDEAMSFAELMKHVQSMSYDTIVFDTAPTGHTLRLLSFPSVLEKAFEKFAQIKNKFSPLVKQFGSLMGTESSSSSSSSSSSFEEKIFSKLESTKQTVSLINSQFRDPDLTTFVCVCIPEFLSLFETERLVQELSRYEIDTHTVVVNQVLVKEKGSTCRKCTARCKMQSKYLSQIDTLYEDFDVVKMPLLDEEVRGVKAIKQFAEFLRDPVKAHRMAEGQGQGQGEGLEAKEQENRKIEK